MKFIRRLCLVAAFILMIGCFPRPEYMRESVHKGLEDELTKQVPRLPQTFIVAEYDHKLSGDEAQVLVSDKFKQLGYDNDLHVSIEGDAFSFIHEKTVAYENVEPLSTGNTLVIDAVGSVVSLKPNLSWSPPQILVTWDYTMIDSSGTSSLRGMRLKIVYGIDATKAEECVNLYKQNSEDKTVAECISNATTLIEAPFYNTPSKSSL